MRKISRNGISIILIIVYTELILGGLGNMFHLPVRSLLFLIMIIYTTLDILKCRKLYINKKIASSIILIFCFIGFYILINLYLNSEVKRGINYLTVYLSILYIPMIQQLIRNDRERLGQLVELFLKYIWWLSIVTILLFAFSFIAQYVGIDALEVLVEFREKSNYGFITGWLFDNKVCRIYFANGIYMQIALAVVLLRIANKIKVKHDYLKLVTYVVAIIVSNTRGYWLGMVTVFIMVIIISKQKMQNLVKIIAVTGLALVLINQLGFANEFIHRITNITNFKTEMSNIQRRYQLEVLNQGIKKAPILGHGVGANIDGYYELTGRDSNDIELFYNELMYKCGMLGFTSYIFIILRIVWKIINKMNMLGKWTNYKCYQVGWAIGIISIMCTSVTNPYLKGANGFFSIIMLFIIYNVMTSKEEVVKKLIT